MKEIYCNKCGEELIIEDEEDILEDKDFYCEECWDKPKINLKEEK